MYRIIRPNGVFRVSVPDFEKLVEIYSPVLYAAQGDYLVAWKAAGRPGNVAELRGWPEWAMFYSYIFLAFCYLLWMNRVWKTRRFLGREIV